MVTKYRSDRHQALRKDFPPDGRRAPKPARKAAWRRALQWIRTHIARGSHGG